TSSLRWGRSQRIRRQPVSAEARAAARRTERIVDWHDAQATHRPLNDGRIAPSQSVQGCAIALFSKISVGVYRSLRISDHGLATIRAGEGPVFRKTNKADDGERQPTWILLGLALFLITACNHPTRQATSFVASPIAPTNS